MFSAEHPKWAVGDKLGVMSSWCPQWPRAGRMVQADELAGGLSHRRLEQWGLALEEVRGQWVGCVLSLRLGRAVFSLWDPEKEVGRRAVSGAAFAQPTKVFTPLSRMCTVRAPLLYTACLSSLCLPAVWLL